MHRLPSTFSSRSIPAFLLLLTLITYGLLAIQLGYYWDDWAKILVGRLYGPGGYLAYYAYDRPLSAWTQIVLNPLLRDHPLAWQALGILLRWLGAWGMVWALNALWPRAGGQNLLAAVIFLVHPVFLQQPAAVTFHQQLLQFVLFFGSLGAMAQAVQAGLADGPGSEGRARRWTALALAGLLLHLSITEYFVSLELLRPLLLWFLLARAYPPFAARARRVWVGWLPYLLALAGFVGWRLFFYRLAGSDPHRLDVLHDLLTQPLQTAQHQLAILRVDLSHILVNSWVRWMAIPLDEPTPLLLLAYAAAIACGGMLVFYLARLATAPADSGELRSWRSQAVTVGLAATLLGPVPAWVTGLQVVDDFHSNRFALPAMFGASLLLAVLIDWLASRRLQKGVLAALLLVPAVAGQIQAQNDYRWVWTAQQRFYWQLSWRAPGLAAPTALFFEDQPFPNQGLFSTSSAVNLLYPQPPGADQLGYWVYSLQPRFVEFPASAGIPVRTHFRSLRFSAAIPESLLLYNDPRHANCLWVLSERDRLHPYLPELVKANLPISNLDRILPTPAAEGYPPRDLFGPEPERGWCYYFEKGDLARQQGNWPQAAGLGDEARARGYGLHRSGSNAPYEWLPFIEAYRRTGRAEDALALAQAAYERDALYAPMLCALWAGQVGSPAPAFCQTAD